VFIDGAEATALLDTGSAVSTVSEQFYTSHLSHLELCELKGELNIECADGSALPYLGFIKADLSVPGFSPNAQLARICLHK
jgi:hypothetical protein